jgi:hypothetical protein
MFKVGDLVKIRIRRGKSDSFQGIILKTWTAYRYPCRTPYINAWVHCFNGTEIEVPTWSMEALNEN